MKLGLPALVRTTTFRLALVQAAVFTLFAFLLLGYLYFTTVGQLDREAERAAAQEFDSLALLYAQGGDKALNQEVIQRAATGGPNLYGFADAKGQLVSGAFDRLPFMPNAANMYADFEFEAPNKKNQVVRHRAIGRLGRLLGGPILLVARDMGDASAIGRRISNTIWTGGLLGLAFSLAAGLIASREAARRVETLSRTAQDVMAGDLTRRAPVRGVDDEFDILARDLNAMLARLERLVQSSRTAGDAIAHDLRTPLSRLRQKVETTLEGASTEADREALRGVLDETDQVLATFNAILRLARLQSAAGWKFEPVDISAITRDITEFYEPVAEDACVTLTGFATPGLSVPGDASLITQALSNLVENAIKFAPPSGAVRIETIRGTDGRVIVSVADNGPGVPEEDRARVLERFVRLEAARTTPGSGLGLTLVAAVAELHGAEMALGDGLGGPTGPGLTVWLKFNPARAKERRDA